jgi:hypothetical protein
MSSIDSTIGIEAAMNIGEVLNGVFDEELGWRPSSGAIKPVHVANGLIRALTGDLYETKSLHQLVVWWRAGRTPDEERSFEALSQGESGALFGAIAATAQEFDRTRRYMEGLLGADKAIFPSADKSDFTLTCVQMASRSGNDRGLGEFGASLLREGEDPGPLAKALIEAVRSERPRDPITAAVWPLLGDTPRGTSKGQRASKALQRSHNKAVANSLREAATALASHEAAQGNRLRTLERVVHFVCVATQVHAQAAAADGDLSKRVPLLLAFEGLQHRDLTMASERSLQQMYEAFEYWLAEMLSERIRRERLKSPEGETIAVESTDGRIARSLLRRVGTARQGHAEPDADTLNARMADFETARREFGTDEPWRVLGHTLVASYLREFTSGGPRAFLQGLESRTGLVYPHFQGRGLRRLKPSTAILDLMVRACVPAGGAVPLDDFLELLWHRFGFVVGSRRNDGWDDAEYLHAHNVPVDFGALVDNSVALVEQLVAMGLAQRYADNVTFVGDAHAA